MPHLRLTAFFAAFTIGLAAACEGSESPAPTSTPAATSTAAPVVTATLTPTGTPTLLPVLQGQATPKVMQDLVVSVMANDAGRVAQMAQHQRIACTTAQGAGGPPKCPPGTAEGTPVTVFPTGRCEGTWVEDARSAIAGLMAQPLQLYAAATLRLPASDPEPYWPKGRYVVMFTASNPSASAPGTVYFILDGDNVLRAHATCDTGADNQPALLKALNAESFLIPPR